MSELLKSEYFSQTRISVVLVYVAECQRLKTLDCGVTVENHIFINIDFFSRLDIDQIVWYDDQNPTSSVTWTGRL